jgi:hypothetical protein
VGGVDFAYGVRGDPILPNRSVDGARQRQALSALLATLDPAFLDLPDPLLDQLSAGREGADDRQYVTELFGDPASPVFDIDEAARASADITLANLLEPSRLERVRDQGARDPGQLTLRELLDRTIETAFSPAPLPGRQAQLRRVVQMRLVVRLAHLLQDKSATPEVKAAVKARLEALAETLERRQGGDPADLAQDRYLAEAILNPARDELAVLAASDKGFEPPPGMPIGEAGEACWFCDALPPAE